MLGSQVAARAVCVYSVLMCSLVFLGLLTHRQPMEYLVRHLHDMSKSKIQHDTVAKELLLLTMMECEMERSKFSYLIEIRGYYNGI